MKIAVIGSGYVGLVTGACCAEMGHTVTCLDIDETKVKHLQEGKLPFFEPHLEELVLKNQHERRLFFSFSYEQVIPHVEVCFIAVPTPSLPDGSCDLSAVLACSRSIASYLPSSIVIAIKSTVRVGTCQLVENTIQELVHKQGKSCFLSVVSNPEFLKEGAAVYDCMRPDRIILGTSCLNAQRIMRQLYAPFNIQRDKILIMNPESAELTKYAANAMLACRISFMNELSSLCEHFSADIHSVRMGIGSDPRIGYAFLYAGVGYGGSCFPKDVLALQAMGQEAGCPLDLIHAIHTVNERQKRALLRKIGDHFKDGIKDKQIAIWGLAFKPDTDDIRSAPSLDLIKALAALGASLRLYDPAAMPRAQEALRDVDNLYWATDPHDAARGTDAIALLTEWKQFRSIDFSAIRPHMGCPVLFDGRNQYSAHEMQLSGWIYYGMGTGVANVNR